MHLDHFKYISVCLWDLTRQISKWFLGSCFAHIRASNVSLETWYIVKVVLIFFPLTDLFLKVYIFSRDLCWTKNCHASKVFLFLYSGKWQKINGLKQTSDIHVWTIAGLRDDTNLIISRYLPVWTPRAINFVLETYFQTRWCIPTKYSLHTANCWQQLKYWLEDGNHAY